MTAPIYEMIIATTVTVLANGIGALPFLFVHAFPEKIARAGWAISGGMMLSASVFNLIIPGVSDGGNPPVAIGILLGAGAMIWASLRIGDHEFAFSGLSEAGARRATLVLITLFIHSFPEGLAIGVAYGSGEVGLGILMAVAIAIHNIPEGLAVALPLRAEGIGGWPCVGWAIVSGVPQLIASIPAYLAVKTFRPILPYAFGFAAGAMILLVMSEMIPESRASEEQRIGSATAGIGGFLLMMVLQNALVF
jgi:ZIP family zinc transporter